MSQSAESCSDAAPILTTYTLVDTLGAYDIYGGNADAAARTGAQVSSSAPAPPSLSNHSGTELTCPSLYSGESMTLCS